MNCIVIDGIDLFRPDPRAEANYIKVFEEYLKKYKIKEYRDAGQIARVLNELYDWHKNIFHGALTKVAAEGLMRYFLGQYNQFTKIIEKYEKGELSPNGLYLSSQIELPTVQQVLRFIVEGMVQLNPNGKGALSGEAAKMHVSAAYLAAQGMVWMSNLSDQTFYVYPEKTTLTLNSSGGSKFMSLKLDEDIMTKYKDYCVPFPQEKIKRGLMTNNHLDSVEIRSKYLNEVFKKDIGLSFDEIRSLILEMLKDFEEAKGVPFCKKEPFLQTIQKLAKWDMTSIEKVISGLSLDKQRMDSEEQEIYMPKRQYQSLLRPLLHFPHELGPHITWALGMLGESINALSHGLVFQEIPKEWESQPIKQALKNLSAYYSDWFENFIAGEMKKRGWMGISSFDVIGSEEARLPIPNEVGEIDYLGYSPSRGTFILIECKLVRYKHLPKLYRDDISKFVTSSDSYVRQLQRKVEWVKDNSALIFNSFRSLFPQMTSSSNPPRRIYHAIVTYFPTVAALYINEFPCRSFVRFFNDLDNTQHEWPYESGVTAI